MSLASATGKSENRYRLPGIEREGIAQLSLLETALWPLQGGRLPGNKFHTEYGYPTASGRKTASVTVRAATGLQPVDELVLWGLLGTTLSRQEAEPVLLATPYWMLCHLGMDTGGSQYVELRESLLRLALSSYQNNAFYNPESREHEYVAFQFLSILLPTVNGIGQTVDNARCWRIEWNAAFYRFCKATGGNLLFDLDLFRALSPAARRLFLKLKDRFWRAKRVFMNVDDLTINGLGFSASRPLKKRKFDLTNCIRELLDHEILCLGRGQTDAGDLFIRRGKGCYVVSFYEGPYFRQTPAERTTREKNAILDDPLFEPMKNVGIDTPAIRRILKAHSRGMIQRWLRITDAAMHEKPRGFPGFRASPAAFFIDGVENARTPPDWMHAHEKRQEERQWQADRTEPLLQEPALRNAYNKEREAALEEFLASAEGRKKFDTAYEALLAYYRATEPHRAEEAARKASRERVERLYFHFPEFEAWLSIREGGANTGEP